MHKFIHDNFFLFFMLGLLWIVVCIAFMLRRRSLHGPHYPSLDTVNVLFRERFASGCSHKSLMTRLSGAQNCLSVTLTDTELWVTPIFPFTAFAAKFDLDHRISHEHLTGIQRNGGVVTVDYDTVDGESRRIVLRLRRVGQFFDAIKNGTDRLSKLI